ncbi:MAG TPA: DUF72 domain-containing protein [Saprospiraceae bacterium]|nr:DUF72 domain-containing protein [Saprospiraceae bacterium]
MDFGKLPNVDQVDFSLPAEPESNQRLLSDLSTHGQMPEIYVGPTGYNMKPWVGKWYPFGAKDRDFLRHYGTQFNTIEFNTTHYRMPDTASVERWIAETPEDFRFCPKLPQSISHARDLGLSTHEPRIFCETIIGLGVRLGYCFMQLPPHFGPRELPILDRFLATVAPLIPLSVEVRHPMFFQNGPESRYLFDLLRDYHTAAVITDVAGRRDVCHMQLTAAATLIRFVGNDLHTSDFQRIQEWSGRLKQWTDQGLQQVYFFAHEPDNLLAPELSRYCVDTFSEVMPGVRMRGPKEVPGQQGSLF